MIVIDILHDKEAGVFVASSRGGLGLVTEAETIETLRSKIERMLPDLLDGEKPAPFRLILRESA